MTNLKFKVVSDSMTPLIPIGAELDLEKISDVAELKKFDIVVFVQSNQLTCHYIWHINHHFDKGTIFTRALKDDKEDLPFEYKMIVGRVKNFRLSFFTRLFLLLKNRKA